MKFAFIVLLLLSSLTTNAHITAEFNEQVITRGYNISFAIYVEGKAIYNFAPSQIVTMSGEIYYYDGVIYVKYGANGASVYIDFSQFERADYFIIIYDKKINEIMSTHSIIPR